MADPADSAPLAAALAPRKAVLVTGGTGFVGSRLVEALVSAGHDVTVLTRDRARALPLLQAGPVRIITSLDAISTDTRIDAIVNLAGEPISNSPWTRAKRQRIVRSRMARTQDVLPLIQRLHHRPEALVSGSAIGIYGLRGDEKLDESDEGKPCFSREVCLNWERAARRAEGLGVRTVYLRTGLVLDASGGMLARMLAPLEYGLRGRFGDGRHWMSWIHRDDLVRLIVHCLARPEINGPVNGTAPAPVTNRVFTAALGRALHRPTMLPVPDWPLRRLLGGFAEELLLSGQRVLPAVATRSGFSFRYLDLDAALAAITGADKMILTDVPLRPLALEKG